MRSYTCILSSPPHVLLESPTQVVSQLLSSTFWLYSGAWLLQKQLILKQ